MKAYLIVFIVSIVIIVFDLLDFLDLFLIFAVFCNVFHDVLTLFQSFLQMYDWLTDTHAMLLEMLSHLKTCWEKYNADISDTLWSIWQQYNMTINNTQDETELLIN